MTATSKHQVYREGPDGKYRWYDYESAPPAAQPPTAQVKEYEHICLSFEDPDIPHRVKSGPNKGRQAFATKREVKNWEALKRDQGMDFRYDDR